MWYVYEHRKHYDSTVKIVIEADNAREANQRLYDWSEQDENLVTREQKFTENMKFVNSNEIWDLDRTSSSEPQRDQYDIIIPKDKKEYLNLVIDYTEDPSIPFAIRSSRYYFHKTREEIESILDIWRCDFYLICKKVEPPNLQQHRKLKTVYYKAKYKKGDQK